jgi:formate/nitrite transporter FocA (FNT family)
MAWAERKVTTVQLLRNWAIVYIGNFIGGTVLVSAVYWIIFLRQMDD